MKGVFDGRRAAGFFFLLLVMVMLAGVESATGREIAGVVVPESVTIDNKVLVLNGAGIRKKLFIKIYVGALYLTVKRATASEVLSDPGAKRIALSFLYSEVETEKLVDAWNRGFADNHSAEELADLQERIGHFNSLFRTVRQGDVIRLDYLPNEGTRVWINESLQGTVPGEDFQVALLKIWLGASPADEGLKDAMLGD